MASFIRVRCNYVGGNPYCIGNYALSLGQEVTLTEQQFIRNVKKEDIINGNISIVKLDEGTVNPFSSNIRDYLEGLPWRDKTIVAWVNPDKRDYVESASDLTFDADIEDIVVADAASNVVSVSLPSVLDSVGKKYLIKKIDASANPVVIIPDGIELIEGLASKSLTTEDETALLFSDGVEWRVMATAPATPGTGDTGYDTLWFPAGAMTGRMTDGGSVIPTELLVTSGVNMDVMQFSPNVKQYADFTMLMPESWDKGTVKAKFVWTYPSAPAGGTTVEWELSGYAVSNGEDLDSAAGTAQVISDAIITPLYNHTTAATPAITIANTPALGDVINLSVARNIANDDMDETAYLIGVWIQFYKSLTPVEW